MEALTSVSVLWMDNKTYFWPEIGQIGYASINYQPHTHSYNFYVLSHGRDFISKIFLCSTFLSYFPRIHKFFFDMIYFDWFVCSLTSKKMSVFGPSSRIIWIVGECALK